MFVLGPRVLFGIQKGLLRRRMLVSEELVGMDVTVVWSQSIASHGKSGRGVWVSYLITLLSIFWKRVIIH